jgi:hypothetical protein
LEVGKLCILYPERRDVVGEGNVPSFLFLREARRGLSAEQIRVTTGVCVAQVQVRGAGLVEDPDRLVPWGALVTVARVSDPVPTPCHQDPVL